MAVIKVDFTRRCTKTRGGTPLTVSMYDPIVDLHVDAVVEVQCRMNEMTVGEMISKVPVAVDKARAICAEKVVQAREANGLSDPRPHDIVEETLIVEDVYKGEGDQAQNASYLVAGLSVDNRTEGKSPRKVFAADPHDAEFQARWNEAIERGYDPSCDLESALAFMQRVCATEVRCLDEVALKERSCRSEARAVGQTFH